MTVVLLVWNSHCTRVRFTVILSCSDEFAVHSCPLLCLKRCVVKVASGLFYFWSLLRNDNMATNLQRFTLYYGSRRFDPLSISRRFDPPGVSKLWRPAGQIRPAKPFHPAREDILSIMKKEKIYKSFLIWQYVTYTKTKTLHKISGLG